MYRVFVNISCYSHIVILLSKISPPIFNAVTNTMADAMACIIITNFTAKCENLFKKVQNTNYNLVSICKIKEAYKSIVSISLNSNLVSH